MNSQTIGGAKVERVLAAAPQAILDRMEAAGVSNLTCEELARRQVEQINRTPGNLTGNDCPKCLNRGYTMRLDEAFCRHSVECECMAQRRSVRLIERSGMASQLDRYTMDTWQTPEPWQERAKALAMQYADDPAGKWFCMVGSVGTGKSHLCTAIVGLMISRGVEARYMLWRDASVRAKAVINDDAEYSRIVEPLKRVKLLYIDDLFKGGQTEADKRLAFEILNHRYANPGLLTIISSERTTDELLDIDEATGSRIYERSRGFYLPVTGKKNWRLQG